VITFLPYPSFLNCAQVLDNKRLNKQILETQQVLTIVDSFDPRWKNQPLKKMWIGHRSALVQYGLFCYLEWQRRLMDGERGGKLTHKSGVFLVSQKSGDVGMPPWLGDARLHSSHRATLLAKNFEHYSQFGWLEKSELGYFWPL
jgi:hypothetical protein